MKKNQQQLNQSNNLYKTKTDIYEYLHDKKSATLKKLQKNHNLSN